MRDYYAFPQDFLWACATASYQVEGAANADGRGPSVWDTFSHSPGRTWMDQNGDIACDQYHLYKEDVQRLKWLGVKAYRFSVSWSRVFPDGEGAVNEKGVDYYSRLVDELLANDIEPWMTLFHWDLPQALEDRYGGWLGRETAERFGDYAACMAQQLSDRVRHFFTINEFMCFVDQGYGSGVYAPGKRVPRRELVQARHHALLAHGLAVRAVRANAKRPVLVGLADNPGICVPVMETEEHIAASRKAMRETNARYLTALLEGAYLDTYLEELGEDAPEFNDEDMELISSPLDFIGLNVYTPKYVRASESSPRGYEIVPHPPSYPRMNVPWLYVGPQVMYWAPRHLKDIWDVDAVYITENGCACADRPTEAGEILDTDRVMYLRNHFINAHRAVAEGYPLKGYFVWSLLDNFEWAYGYEKRFGLFYTNYATLERTPKLSADFYRQVIARNAVV